jgi:hypothetical protein
VSLFDDVCLDANDRPTDPTVHRNRSNRSEGLDVAVFDVPPLDATHGPKTTGDGSGVSHVRESPPDEPGTPRATPHSGSCLDEQVSRPIRRIPRTQQAIYQGFRVHKRLLRTCDPEAKEASGRKIFRSNRRCSTPATPAKPCARRPRRLPRRPLRGRARG